MPKGSTRLNDQGYRKKHPLTTFVQLGVRMCTWRFFVAEYVRKSANFVRRFINKMAFLHACTVQLQS